MPRRAIYKLRGIPFSVVRVVYSICGDYERREKAIRSDNATEAMVRLNAIVDEALEDIEPAIRRDIISDISDGRGYYKSNCCIMMEKNTYYRRRRKLVYDIAKAMQLL